MLINTITQCEWLIDGHYYIASWQRGWVRDLVIHDGEHTQHFIYWVRMALWRLNEFMDIPHYLWTLKTEEMVFKLGKL